MEDGHEKRWVVSRLGDGIAVIGDLDMVADFDHLVTGNDFGPQRGGSPGGGRHHYKSGNRAFAHNQN